MTTAPLPSARSTRVSRSALLALPGGLSLALALALLAACAADPIPAPESSLHGDAIALLGEVHDNDEGHARRLALLKRVFARGWRPAIAMEQFDIDRQADIDRARRERPDDAQHVIDLAAPPNSGWDWSDYRPVIELALRYDVPLLAANLPGADTSRIVRGGYASVFDARRIDALGLDQPVDPALQAAQEHEIDVGHCGMLPKTIWPAMARAQFARDAVMAELLRTHAQSGIVLLAGNGHARRDTGVVRWLAPAEQRRAVTVGYLEVGSFRDADGKVSTALAAAFDAVVPIPEAARADPCEAFAKKEGRR